MFYVVAIDGTITAHSKSKKVCKHYAKHYMESHPDSICTVLKVVSKNNETLQIDDECELIRVGKIYIQRKYEQAYLVYGYPDEQEYKESIRLLHKELLKESKLLNMMKISENIGFLMSRWYELSHYVPTCSEMDALRQQLLEYEYCVYGN